MDNNGNHQPSTTHSTEGSTHRTREGYSSFDDINQIDILTDEIDNTNRNHVSDGSVAPESARRTLDNVAPPSTVDEKQQALNHMFGIKPWKSKVSHRPLQQRSKEVQKLYGEPSTGFLANEELSSNSLKSVVSTSSSESWVTIANVIYVILCGWWIALAYVFAAMLMAITIVGFSHAKVLILLAQYYFWPFGKFIKYHKGEYAETTPIAADSNSINNYAANSSSTETSTFDIIRFSNLSAINIVANILWIIITWPIVGLAHIFGFILMWMMIVFIPMAKVNRTGIKILTLNPQNLSIGTDYPGPGDRLLAVTFSAANGYYYKYQVGGMNVVLVNLLPFVLVSLVLAYGPKVGLHFLKAPDMVLFFCSLMSVIPLSYYIGMALSSLSAQTSFAVGAVLNATFGSIIELILYFSAILSGELNSLVQASVTGTLLGMMLLLPGLAMLFGGIKNKVQLFNPTSAGVSSVLLIVSVVGAFTPTIFYQIYGHHELNCSNCHRSANNGYDCDSCVWNTIQDLDSDTIFTQSVRPLMWTSAAILPIAYLIGLLFTLKTHAHIIDNPEYVDTAAVAEHGPSAEWSKTRCLIVLLGSTILFALIAEEMVDTLQDTLNVLGISQVFAGLTIIALIPNTAEFVNAIQFSLQNNFSLSLEIASAASVQVALIQMPTLVIFSAFAATASTGFTLIFPMIDLIGVMFAVLIINYISISGKASYFDGAALLIVYFLLVAAFFFVPS